MFRIEKNIPIPQRKKTVKSKYPITQMEVGDSFFVIGDIEVIKRRIYQATMRLRKVEGWKGRLDIQEAHNAGGIPGARIWRIK